MLVKQVKGRDFYGCLAYVLGKPGARPLDATVVATDPESLTQEFQALDSLRHAVQRRVYHCALSLPIGEHLSDHTWRELGKDFLRAMGFEGHQYVLVQHTDRAHEHCHIIANRVGLDGHVVSDAWDYTRAQAVTQQLAAQYGLADLPASWQTERKAMSHRQLDEEYRTGQPCVQRQLQTGIDAVLDDCQSLPQLMTQLEIQGIQTKITYAHDDQPIGITYAKAGVTMSGSNLGKRYTLNRLQQRFQANESAAIDPVVPLVRQQITDTIDQVSQDQPTLSTLIERLATAGIDVHLRFGKLRQERHQVKAISFSQGHVAYLGQSLGDAYHFTGLQTQLGIDYEPGRDHAWFRHWREAQATQKALAPAANVPRLQSVMLADSPVLRRFTPGFRDQAINDLSAATIAAFEQAQAKRYARLQFVTTAAPGMEQWGAVVALKLRDDQAQGRLPAVPALEVVVLTHDNLVAAWSKRQKAQYGRILQAVDRIDAGSVKQNYLTDHSCILEPAASTLTQKSPVELGR